MTQTELEVVLEEGLRSLGMPFEPRISLAEILYGAQIDTLLYPNTDRTSSIDIERATVYQVYATTHQQTLFMRPSRPLKSTYALLYGIDLPQAAMEGITLREAENLRKQQDSLLQGGCFAYEFIQIHAEPDNSVPPEHPLDIIKKPYFFCARRTAQGYMVYNYPQQENSHLRWCQKVTQKLDRDSSPSTLSNTVLQFLREHQL